MTITGGARGNTRFAVNQISTSGDTFDHVVSVRSTFGKRSATSTTNKLDDASLKAVVERAEALARLAPEDPEMMPDLGPQQYQESRDWSDVTAGDRRGGARGRGEGGGCGERRPASPRPATSRRA